MEKYKRLTERVGKGVAIKETSTNDNMSIWNAINRLAELEDKIENGTLVDTTNICYEKTEHLKQFAERLKEKCEYNRKQYCCSATVGASDIDETLKELKG